MSEDTHEITIIGTGVMGKGIAHVAALGGFKTNIYDISEKQLDNAVIDIKKQMNKGVELKKVTQKDVDKALNNIHLYTDLKKSVEETQFVIEAIPEDIKLKCTLFEKLDKITHEDTILATNTSTMSPTEIGGATNRPEKVIAMHFFNPVHKMKLVEIIRGMETSDETYEITEKISNQMQKETVMVNEAPGFVTSRISSLIGNEAFKMLETGVASAQDIDKAIKLGLNFPMGPLELGDLVGLDTRLKILNHLSETLGSRYKPSPLMVKYVKAGRTGKKVGKGVFDYQDEK